MSKRQIKTLLLYITDITFDTVTLLASVSASGWRPPAVIFILPENSFEWPLLSINDRSCGDNSNLITLLSPTFKNVLSKPFKALIGTLILAFSCDRYSSVTSSPSILPVLVILTLTAMLFPLFTFTGTVKASYLKVV